jgi:hypothetical protein
MGKTRFRLVCSARAHAGALSHGVAKVVGANNPYMRCFVWHSARAPACATRNRLTRMHAYTHVYADAYMCSLCRMCSLYSYTHVHADASLLQDGLTPMAWAKRASASGRIKTDHDAMQALLRQHGGDII